MAQTLLSGVYLSYGPEAGGVGAIEMHFFAALVIIQGMCDI
jgi:hypothetical protein